MGTQEKRLRDISREFKSGFYRITGLGSDMFSVVFKGRGNTKLLSLYKGKQLIDSATVNKGSDCYVTLGEMVDKVIPVQ